MAQQEANSLQTQVQAFEVQGNTLLEPAVVNAALGTTPQMLDMQGLQHAAQRLQQAYREAGYGAVVVLLPAQSVEQGRVRLQVVEGKLRSTQVSGWSSFSQDNHLRSLPSLQQGQTPRLSALDSELLMVNENPSKSVRVVLQPGDQQGDVNALVVVQEQPVQRWYAGLDNTGNSSTGQWRLSANYQHANVGDSDAVLGLRAVTSPTHPSRVAVLGSTLRLPLYAQRMFVEGSLLLSNVRSDGNYTPAGELRFSGKGFAAGARAIWLLPSLQESKAQAALGLDVRSYRNDCSLGQFGSAGCGAAAVSVDVLPLTASYMLNKPGSHQLLVSALANLPIGRAGKDAQFAASRPGASSRYRIARLNGGIQHALSRQTEVNLRLDAQWAGNPLVSAEQLGAGGMHSVRGYQEREVVGDSGAIGSVELKTRWLSLAGDQGMAWSPVLSVFADAATLRNRNRNRNRNSLHCMPGRTHCSVWSIGAGVSLKPFQGTTLRVDGARAGKKAYDSQRGDWRWHVSLTHQL